MSLTIPVARSIARQLHTPRGSRVMRPEFGSRLYTLADRRGGNSLRQDSVRFAHEAIRSDARVQSKSVAADGYGKLTVSYTADAGDGTVEV